MDHTEMDDTERLRALELALARRDQAAIPGGYEAVLHESLVEFGANGRVWTRDEVLEALTAGALTDSVGIEAFDVQVVRPGVFLVMFETTETDPATGLTARQRRSSLWMREADGFRLRFRQSTTFSPG